jgi:alpha-L-fucosidase
MPISGFLRRWLGVLAALGMAGLMLGGQAGSVRAGVPTCSVGQERFEYSKLLMGAKARVVVYAHDEPSARAGATAAFEEIARLEAIMSDYRPDSPLSRISEQAGQGPQPAPIELLDVLKHAQTIADLADGAFDPTLGLATKAWRRTRDSGILPSRDEQGRLVTNGFMHLLIDPDAGTVELLEKDLRLDLGGIGKGFAAQHAVDLLRHRGLARCLVSIAGDVVVGEPPPGQDAWTVGVDVGWPESSLSDVARPFRAVRLVNQAVSTSGDAEQHVRIDGERYSHIIDPATGLGLTTPRTACVVSNDGATADALATALCVLGPARARATLARFEHELAFVLGAKAWDDLALPERFENDGFPWASAREQPQPADQPHRPPSDSRLDWFRHDRFGLFIHWGLYSVLAGEWEGRPALGTGEWIMDHYDIAPDIYEKTAARFNPVKFDAKTWAALAKEAGMKYVVITTKHHEGFSLFDSAHTEYDVVDATPFKRDIMRELADAVRAEGLRIGWYHSIMDWHHPDANPFPFADPAMAARQPEWASYTPVLRDQVRELLTNYGPIAVMWFDGEWVDQWTDAQGWEMYRMCRELQPGTLVNNRVGKGRDGMAGLTKEAGVHPGDFGTPEQEVPSTGLPGLDWESCMTMNDTWGYNTKDANWKSTTTLIRTLIETASKGGNFLLNVGPTGEGVIPPESVERLREIGAWLRVNGPSIYGTHAGPFKRLPWGRCTSKAEHGEHVLYAHVIDPPERGNSGSDGAVDSHCLVLPGLRTGVRRVWALADPNRRTLAHRRLDDHAGVEIDVARVAWQPHATVLVVELDAPPEVVDLPITLRPTADGAYLLPAHDAWLDGGLKLEHLDGPANIGFWTSLNAAAWWEFRGLPAGRYRVVGEIAVEKSLGGGSLVVQCGQEQLSASVSAMGSWSKFAPIPFGELTIPPNATRLSIKATKLENIALMNLRQLRLEPTR